MEFIISLDNTLNNSLIYCSLAISIYISLRLLDFPDLSIEGTFPLGAAIAASVAHYTGLIYVSIPIAVLGGFIIGLITASLHIYLNIGKLLSGILVAVGLYSINFRILGARSNIYLTENDNILAKLREVDILWKNALLGEDSKAILYPFSNIVLLIVFAIIVYLLLRFLKTEKGSLIRFGRSDNKLFFESLGINYKINVLVGIGLANAFAALSGALVAFSSGSATTTMGFGIILVALVSLVIGERIVGLFHEDLNDLWPTILSPVVGTFSYYLIIRLVRWLNTKWQLYSGHTDPADQFQFFNSDIKILAVIIMVLIYVFRRQKQPPINLPDRL